MNFLFTCGGTAGHVNPAIAVAGRLREIFPDCGILFLGAEGQMEMQLLPREGYEVRPLHITNISRGKGLSDVAQNISTVKNVLASMERTRHVIREFRPDAVIGTGGYVCYPVLMQASRMHIPTLVHESNAVPGLTTRLLAGHVDRIMVGFEESRASYPDPQRVTVTGTPVRGAFSAYTKESARRQLGLDVNEKLVVSVWGSLGSGHMNEKLVELLPLMHGQKDFHMIHAVGSRDWEETRAAVQAQGIRPADCGIDMREYIYDMPRVMAAADLILCRAGASTLAELTYMGKPAVLIPSPNVTNHHQERNARVLEHAGAARVLLEGEFTAESLLRDIRTLLDDADARQSMAEHMHALSVPDATEKIVGEILDLLHHTVL